MRLFEFLLLLTLALHSSIEAKDPDEIFADSVNGVVYLKNFLPGGGFASGSGVLIDKQRRLVATNAHVVKGEKTLQAFFPIRGQDGLLKVARSFYEENVRTLKQIGIESVARVVAVDIQSDLAILQLSGVPESAQEIEIDKALVSELDRDDRVHILGHPTGRDLWRWSQGSYIGRVTVKNADDKTDFWALSIFGTAYFGNSGGAVLNDEGKLIGITQSITGEGGTKVYAVHIAQLNPLIETVKKYYVFSILNKVKSDVPIRITDCKDEPFNYVIPAGNWIAFPCTQETPAVSYSYQSRSGNAVTKEWNIKTYGAHFGFGSKLDRTLDSREYSVDWSNGDLLLFDDEGK